MQSNRPAAAAPAVALLVTLVAALVITAFASGHGALAGWAAVRSALQILRFG